MPLYEFTCKKCNKKIEKLLTLIESKNEYYCEECGELLKKMIGSSQLKFKGHGFYITDYKKG